MLNDRIGDQSVAGGIVMGVPEDEEVQVPAAGLDPRALVLRGKKWRKSGDESLALALAPLAPNAHLPGIHRVVNKLCGPGINDNEDEFHQKQHWAHLASPSLQRRN